MFKNFIITALLLSLAFCGDSSSNNAIGSDLVFKQIPTENLHTDAHLLELFDFGVTHVLEKILINTGVTDLDFEASVWWVADADGNYNANHYTEFKTVVDNHHGITFNITFTVREFAKGGKDVFHYKYKGWYDDELAKEIKACRESKECVALGEIELDVEVVSSEEAEEICEEAEEEESGNNGGTEVEIPEEEEEECEEEEEAVEEEECEEEEEAVEEEECEEEEEEQYEEEEECEEEAVEEEESGNNGGTEVEIPEEEEEECEEEEEEAEEEECEEEEQYEEEEECEVEIEVEVEECEEEEEEHY